MALLSGKQTSESLLSSLTKDLKPDIPTYNRLKRSCEELERRRFTQSQHLRHSKEQIVERTQQSIQLLSRAEKTPSGVPEGFPKTCIPGFRYKANGDTKQTVEEARKETLMRSLTGLSRHVFDGKSRHHSSPMVTTTQQPSSDSLLSSTILGVQGEQLDLYPKKHRINNPFVFHDDDSDLRVRKVQEQLGLLRHQGSGQGSLDELNDKTIGLHPLEHHFKIWHLSRRNSDVDLETDTTLNNRSRGRKRLVHKASSSLSQNISDHAASTAISSKTTLRDRCGACKFTARSDVMELVKSTNPLVFSKPRWKYPPAGRYVSPPPRTANPTLYRHSRRKLVEKINVGDPCGPENANMSACTSWRSGGDRFGPSPALIALQKKNSKHTEALEEKMRKFLNSLPQRNWMPLTKPVLTS